MAIRGFSVDAPQGLWWRRTTLMLLLLYLVQAAVVTHAAFSPVIEREDGQRKYVVTRFFGFWDYVPALGLIHHVTGEPVRFVMVNKVSGRVYTRWYDIVFDAQTDYPILREAEFNHRLLDSK